jgi:Na+/H+ antiporter NhaD/arsenite permease-like protein
MTANATSFLWPTSNLTTLLVVSRSPLSPTDYATRSWISWVLVTAVTVCGLSVFVERGRRDDAAATGGRHIRGAAQTLAGLLPLYVAASAIRALLGAVPLQLGSGMLRAAGVTAVVAAAVNNLPAAAAVAPSGTRAAWVAVLALAIGPNLLVTGSVATLIARQLARRRGVTFAPSRRLAQRPTFYSSLCISSSLQAFSKMRGSALYLTVSDESHISRIRIGSSE